MKIKTAADTDLRNLLGTELRTLREYEEMFDSMTSEEKGGLREWIACGNSVNGNPYLIHGENGCLMDFIAASRAAEDMADNPELYRSADKYGGESELHKDMDMPF